MSIETIASRFTSGSVDEPISLFSGDISLSWDGQTFTGDGEIRLDWRPHHRIYFRVSVPSHLGLLHIEPTENVLVEIRGGEGRGNGHVWGSDISGPKLVNEMFGTINGQFLVGNPAATEIVRFHVPNFPNYVGAATTSGSSVSASRLIARTDRWQVDVDGTPGSYDIYRTLNGTGGYGITNVGILKRVDGKEVKFEEVDGLLSDIYWWLSLLRGERTGPILISGEHKDEVIWEIWQAPNVARWSGRKSWLPINLLNNPGDTPDATSPILAYLTNSPTNERSAIIRAISWYTQSVENSYLETTFILAQAGLELIAWLRLREVGIDEGAINRWEAADEFRLVLTLANIPLDIPTHFANLSIEAKGKSGADALDGPGSIVTIRNGAVHPKSTARFADIQAIVEASLLAIRYLELLILNRCQYQSQVLDRTNSTVGKVPWA